MKIYLTSFVLLLSVVLSLNQRKKIDLLKLKALANDKINVIENFEVYFEKDRKYCGKRRKCWLPAFSPFPKVFSKLSFSGSLKDCVAKG